MTLIKNPLTRVLVRARGNRSRGWGLPVQGGVSDVCECVCKCVLQNAGSYIFCIKRSYLWFIQNMALIAMSADLHREGHFINVFSLLNGEYVSAMGHLDLGVAGLTWQSFQNLQTSINFSIMFNFSGPRMPAAKP